MPRGVKHSDETRAAVMAALLAGQGVSEVAQQYSLDESTVRNWKRRMAGSPVSGTPVNPVNAKNEVAFDELLATYLRETLTTLAVQQRHFRDEAWLRGQNASDLAVLHGVSTDKAIRLLEALQAGAGEE